MNDLPLVSISCITFNHARYLRECFDGFLMQQTNFAFEVVIHDDASTDETKAIIEEYTQKHPTIFYPMYQTENQYSKGVRGIMAKFNFPRCRGKYITLCEGDDYWTDPNKLQKQVDFLEANEDYAICWTKYLIKNESNVPSTLSEPEWIDYVENDKDLSFDLNNIFKPYCTYTLTTMFRVENFDFDLFQKLKHSKDNTLYAMCLSKGKGILLNFNSAVYRVHDAGIYSLQKSYINAISNYLNFVEIIITFKEARNNHFLELMKYFKYDLRSSLKQHNKEVSYYYYVLKGFKMLVANKCLSLFKYI
ncbi:glycosyltransferase family 2 protein [Flavobacterium koreense]